MHRPEQNQERRGMKVREERKREAIKKMAGGGAVPVKWETEAISADKEKGEKRSLN